MHRHQQVAGPKVHDEEVDTEARMDARDKVEPQPGENVACSPTKRAC